MNGVKYFFDTNILVYTFDLSSPAKAKRAEELIFHGLDSGHGMISYQVVQEFITVMRRFSKPLTFDQIARYWTVTLLPLLVVHSSPALFNAAMNLASTQQLSWYDSLIVSAAIQGRCKILYSEDLQDGRRFGDLVVKNPFL